MSESRYLEKRLFSAFRRTCERHELFRKGDRVLVAVSGGKDSHVLLHFLHLLNRTLASPIELIAVHLDQRQPGYEGGPLADYLRGLEVPFEILSEDTYSTVTRHIPSGKGYCSLCSRLRRGILYSAAERLQCNKLALGHHREDTLETFLLNLFFAGKLQAMPVKYRTDDGRFEVVRPLLECAETSIAEVARARQVPIVPCNLCGSAEGLQRARMRALLAELEREHPHLRAVMLNSIGNVRPTHLLDQDIQEAWRLRPPDLRPAPAPRATRAHARALPVVAWPQLAVERPDEVESE